MLVSSPKVDRFEVRREMPIQERRHERRRAERPDQGLALVLLTEGVQERELLVVHGDDPAASHQKLQGHRVKLAKDRETLAVFARRQGGNVELEVLAVIVEVELVLRSEQRA